MYYHSDVSCEDQCAGLVWTADPWTIALDGVVHAAKYPKFEESITNCKGLGYGVFCRDGARSTESGDGDFQSLVQTRTINYFCRDYAGNEAEENGHVIHVVDTSPPKLALSHLCHDNGVHDDSGQTGTSGERWSDDVDAGANYTRTDGGADNATHPETEKHHRAFNNNFNARRTDDGGCVDWNSNFGEESGADMFVSAGYHAELEFLDL